MMASPTTSTARTNLIWQKLSPSEFQTLQEYASYSNAKMSEVLLQLRSKGIFKDEHGTDCETIGWAAFQQLLCAYLDAPVPLDLCRHLFMSFVKQPQGGPENGVGTFTHNLTLGDKKSNFKSKISELSERVQELRGRISHSNSGQSMTSNHTIDMSDVTEVSAEGTSTASQNNAQVDFNAEALVRLKDIVCYLSLLEAGRPEDKLEFVFHLYDSDGNGYLDSAELESIIEQMMNVAKYLEWDTIELEPIVRDMMCEIDYDSDGRVTLREWKRGGLGTVPLLVLLGLDTEMKEDGAHHWRLSRFKRPAVCNICLQWLVAWGGKQGLSCTLCKYTVHERCVSKAPNNCIRTYVKSAKRSADRMMHHWVDANCTGKCHKCKKSVKTYDAKHCRWCQTTIHTRCATSYPAECSLGVLCHQMLPPTAIYPAVLQRNTSTTNTEPVQVQHKASSTSSLHTAFHINAPEGTTPLFVFINPKSGGKQGEKLYRKFLYLLNPRQVYNLSKGGPKEGLQLMHSVSSSRVLCCGGDGTVGWVLDAMDSVYGENEQRPAVAVLPLGTGNDLARCLRWGGGYEHESLLKIMGKVDKAHSVTMDRWHIHLTQSETDQDTDPMPNTIINNYFSIGVDASIAHRFHTMREKHPEKFNSRMKNKLWYFEFGTGETFAGTCKNLHEQLKIVCDGVALELSSGVQLEGIAILNIPSIYGGSNLWGDPDTTSGDLPAQLPSTQSTSSINKYVIQAIGDGLIEVVGLESAMAVAQITAGLRGSGRRMAQCSSVQITTYKRMPMQVDGEPWMQAPCTLNISHKNQVPMLMASKQKKSKTWSLFPWNRAPTPENED